MADQASVRARAGFPPQGHSPVSGDGHGVGNGKSVVGNLADFANDIATLLELQAKLAAADLTAVKGRVVGSTLALAGAAVFALAALPVLLFGVAHLLALALSLHLGWALLITAGFVLAIAGLVVVVVLPRFLSSFEPLRRSKEELIRNLSWVRTVVVYSGRSFPPRK